MSTFTKTTLTVVAGGLAVAALAGCSSSSSSPSASPTPTASPTTTSTAGLCTDQAVLAVLPSGAKMVSLTCKEASGTLYAAVKVDPGPTVFFLQAQDGKWGTPEEADDVCGTASAGLPPEILAYCEQPSPSGSKSKSASASPSKS